ncbi:cobaltochelatase subunit CobN [Kouleothrix sp.]|uniref:cobaltochelatase subunit CobN n=1 Tax=Kouleothrix sp. TaxID=2779161 RepID=UPI00391B2DE6
MATLTFIAGMERFNAHVWDEVAQALRAGGVGARLLRFNDDHVERRDPALAQAIGESDVVFVTLINMRSQADWLAEQIGQASPRAVFAFESMPEVMALNRVGEYRVQGGKGSLPKPMQLILRLLTQGREEDTLYAYTKLTKITAKLLPLMPAKLHDFRTWLSVNIYWNQPDAANITQMIRLILRDCLGQKLDVAPPRLIPMMGCFHPDSAELFDGPEAYLKWQAKRRKSAAPRAKSQQPSARLKHSGSDSSALGLPTVALLAFRKHVVQQQRYLGELVHTLEAQGLAVLPIFVSGIEAHVAVREWIARQPVDLILSTMGFPLVGGPAGSTKPGHYQQKASDMLAGIDVPYMVAQPLQMQTEQQWHEQGVAPMQAVIMYDLPEMDGSIAPVALGAIRDQLIVATPDRLERTARQAAGWVRLRHTPPAEKKLAVVLYNYPPGLGKLGTAALLDVPASLLALLRRLRAEGYSVGELPASADELAQRIAAIEHETAPGAPGHRAVGVDEYRRIVPLAHADRVERQWGRAPGDIAPAGRDAIRIDGLQFGNVFVGVQPPMGVPGDPMRLLFDPEFAPHHQYVAFYRWLSESWRADAVVHFGMHGTAEWTPGLKLGLTERCWPDLLLGSTPQLYLYPLNNPSEALLARRRGFATIVSHAVPPYARAGLYKQLALLRTQVADAKEQAGGAPATCPELPDLPRATGETDAAYLGRLSSYLDELEQRLILDGLHVFGQNPAAERAAALIEAALDVPRDGRPGLSQALREAGVPATQLKDARAAFVQRFVLGGEAAPDARLAAFGHEPLAAELIGHGRQLLKNMAASDELGALIHALAGGFVRPAVGADPVRAGAGALPSGRNIHSIDPWRLPTDTALARGAAMAQALLERHLAEHGEYPQTVAQPLWALDTIKSEGEGIAVALALLGARPERDGQGKIWRYELVPLAELGRPRVDLLLDISSIFRDTFQMTLDLLDDLFRRAAAAEEPASQNFVRAHALELQAQGQSWEQATARIFTQAPGQYGTGVEDLVDESAWENNSQLAETYQRRSSFSYGGGRAGTAAPETLRGLLGTVDHVFQAIDSVEYGLTDMQHYYGHSGAIQLAASQARGGAVPLSYAESYTGSVKLNSAAELLRMEARSKILNPRWYEGMLAHGFAGAAEIGQRFTYLLGWSATSDIVDPWVFDQAAATFVLDEQMRQRIAQANPQAARNAVARLLEAHGRGMWPADDTTIERLQELYGDLEDRLEGLAVGA